MKTKTKFVCQQCGTTYAKWVGQCANCSAWNSLVEQVVADSVTSAKSAIAKGQASGKKLKFEKIAAIVSSDVIA